MNPAKPAIGHENDQIALFPLFDDGADDIVERGSVSGALSPALEIVHELLWRKPLSLGEARAKHRRDNHLVGGTKCAREILLEDAPARGRGTRLEYRPDATVRISGAETRQGFGDGG